ncbi:hypothetical protein DSM100238_1012 [Bifidobacterium apri]|uniref:Uncharacterized protein n=1 Tax=Bifidobacterium apri TaxID=1769423 RepID=A0A6A2V8K1_9BIFI|nr:hypothetical protein DSM100238_1012 [Bifidobacterium apri]
MPSQSQHGCCGCQRCLVRVSEVLCMSLDANRAADGIQTMQPTITRQSRSTIADQSPPIVPSHAPVTRQSPASHTQKHRIREKVPHPTGYETFSFALVGNRNQPVFCRPAATPETVHRIR